VYTVLTLAGSGSSGQQDGVGKNAIFYNPMGVAVDVNRNVFVADTYGQTIRKVSSSGLVSTIAGRYGSAGYSDGQGTYANFYYPLDVAVDTAGKIYVADKDANTIRQITPSGFVSTLAGRAGSASFADGLGTNAYFYYPTGVAVDSVGDVFVADQYNHRIRQISSSGMVSTLAGGGYGFGDGTGTNAYFYNPSGVAVDTLGYVYVADYQYCRLRKVTLLGAVSTLAGWSCGYADGQGTAASFSNFYGVAVSRTGPVFVADTSNYRVRKVTPKGFVTTFAGSGSQAWSDGLGTAASFWSIKGVALDSTDSMYVTESVWSYWGSYSQRIRKISVSTSAVSTVAGTSACSFGDGWGTSGSMCNPFGVAVNDAGEVYVADSSNNRVRVFTGASFHPRQCICFDVRTCIVCRRFVLSSWSNRCVVRQGTSLHDRDRW
jgi:hypothetical protein